MIALPHMVCLKHQMMMKEHEPSDNHEPKYHDEEQSDDGAEHCKIHIDPKVVLKNRVIASQLCKLEYLSFLLFLQMVQGKLIQWRNKLMPKYCMDYQWTRTAPAHSLVIYRRKYKNCIKDFVSLLHGIYIIQYI